MTAATPCGTFRAVIFRSSKPNSPTAGIPLFEVIAQQLPEATAETQRIVTAVAGLLACVAYADREFSEAEAAAVRRELARIEGLNHRAVAAICAVLEDDDSGVGASDFHLWTRELLELCARPVRLEVLDVLVDLAAADNEITMSETNLLRRTTTALGLDQDDYNDSQRRHRDKLTVLKR